jgi:hypothetical protein
MLRLITRLKRRIQRLLKVQSESRQRVQPTVKTRTIKILLLILVSVLLVVLYPGEDLFDPFDIPRKGEFALEDVIAPFDITILRSEQELQRERDVERQSVPLVLTYDTTKSQAAYTELNTFTVLIDSLRKVDVVPTPEAREQRTQLVSRRFPLLSSSAIDSALAPSVDLKKMRSTIARLYREDIYHIGVLEGMESLPASGSRSVSIRRGDQENLVQRDQIYGKKVANGRLLTTLNRIADRDSINVDLCYLVGKTFIVPNLTPNLEEYNQRLERALATVSPIKRIVENEDIIVRAGQTVTEEQEEVLLEMARIQRVQAAEQGFLVAALPFLGRILFVMAAFAALYLFLYFFRKTVYISNPKVFALLLVFGLQFVLIYLTGLVANSLDVASNWIYPVAFLPIVVTILFDAEIGVLATIILALLLGIMHRFSFSITLMTIAVGFVASFMSRRVHKRTHFYRIMVSVILAYIILIAVIETLKLTPNPEIGSEILYGSLTAVITIILAIFFLPIFEALFGFTTDYTLLELSDLNHPLLKRLALEAPGTYHHSIVVSNLAEAAAKEIGANALLARVGCYYHDIGKMEIPEYFVENQLSLKSKHEALTPSMSSIILSAHVKKGRWLGEEAGIPDDVLNFIEEHHGTMVMSYFYDKALKQGADPGEKDKYRYPGPKPQIKETGIAMLADAVEAASRTLEDPKPARISALIQRIIDDRFQSGELNECPLTLRDLAGIKRSFGKVLMAAFHHRVAYPNKADD